MNKEILEEKINEKIEEIKGLCEEWVDYAMSQITEIDDKISAHGVMDDLRHHMDNQELIIVWHISNLVDNLDLRFCDDAIINHCSIGIEGDGDADNPFYAVYHISFDVLGKEYVITNKEL